uniref:5'-3' exoribonuclease 1 n=1 Tax=Denticeps clupeoides TaxID=299321 RepID=A0AAY4AD68_9TELE
MGVPKFYRWISERYPCLSEVVKDHQIPEFDNLYLDMNGIIHQCSHPNDEDVHFRISEEKIFADIFHYLEVLFRIIRPRKVFFMAVDGVAPRAKMNQQRGRRFRSAKEAEEKIKKALDKGEVLPTEARFDSNCITPGTDFMARLQEQLKYFVHNKLSTDKTWQGVKVYLSGHETPGEGEHKIMEFIRSENAQPNHDPNTRHCLYGLDADLIMLGLTSHEPNFSLLREEVRFGGKKSQKRITAPEETTFHLLHLSLMREYIDYEFAELRDKISFEYNLERIIDDWILMGFLVGNDFIPHLPHLHINHDALPLLYRTYISVLPSLDGYLHENGVLNLANFEKYLEKLSEFDREHFQEVFVDLKWFESKVGNKYLNEAAGKAAEEERCVKKIKEDSLCLAALEGGKESFTKEDCEEEEIFEAEFRQYKRTYYMTKMGVEVVSDEFLACQAKCYVEGLQWILHYYFHGVQSWSWYYPNHYAPFLSDVRNIAGLKLTFDMAKPFMPFEQLLAVLPAASKELLPQCYQHLMTSQSSAIIEYYPLDFKTDLNGKQQEWEAVVLIPFIDEKCLLSAMEPYSGQLKPGEMARNRHTECALYAFSKELDYPYTSSLPELFPNIIHCHVKVTNVPMDAWHVSLDHKVHSFDRGALYYCGFPTLQHIRHKFFKKKCGVLVFQQSSRGENMMLEIVRSQEGEIQNITMNSDWFFLDEPPGVQKLYLDKNPPPFQVTYLSDKEQKDWVKDVQGISEHKRKGIFINETVVVVYAQLLSGRKYVPGQNRLVHLEKQWAKQILPFAYQTIVKDIKAFDSSLSRFMTLEDLFSPTTSVFMLGNPYYGAMGEVQDSSDVISEGRIRVVFTVPCEPQLDALIQNQHKYSVKYCPGYVLASRLGITSYLVSRFSGSVFIGRGSKKNPHGEQKANVGLNLKFNKKNEEVPGYTRRTEKEWLYSGAVEELLAEYLERFSEVFDAVSRNSHDDVFYEDDIWPGEDENGAERVQEITNWLKTHPVSSSSRASCDLQILDSGIVEKIEDELEKKSSKKVRVTVKPHLLYRVSVCFGYQQLFYIYILNVCSPGRGYRMPTCALINLSHGSRLEQGSHKLTAIVKPQPAFTSQHAKSQLAGLNHSPRSPFIPTQVRRVGTNNPIPLPCANSFYKKYIFLINLNPVGGIRLLKRNEDIGTVLPQTSTNKVFCIHTLMHTFTHKLNPYSVNCNTYALYVYQVSTEFEELIANLKISKSNDPPGPRLSKETTDQSGEPLSPQSFAMKGTLMLKEMLKIDSGPQEQSVTQLLTYLRTLRTARMNTEQADASGPAVNPAAPIIPSMASELGRICMGLGMAPPEFAFLRGQGLVVCQVKLSNGLLVHGPQCQSENDAKEKVSLFALQRLVSLLIRLCGLLMPPQGYGSLPWGVQFSHQGQPYYGNTFPGARAPPPSIPVGSHNQFVPLQVTKKRVSGRKNQENKEFSSSAHAIASQLNEASQSAQTAPPPATSPKVPSTSSQTSSATPSTPRTPKQNPNPHTPGSASKRRHRKLAVNFEAAKITD